MFIKILRVTFAIFRENESGGRSQAWISDDPIVQKEAQ